MSHLSLVEVSSLPPSCHASYPPNEPSKSSSLDDLAAKLAVLSKDPSVEQVVETGRLVIEQLYAGDLEAWRSREPKKAHSLRALAGRVEVAVSSSALYRSIALFELSERLGGIERWTGAGLGISHMRLVIGLAHEDQVRLLDAAVQHSWTVVELEREAVAVRGRSPKRGSRGGRPRLPRFLKSVNRLRRAVEAPDEMFGDLEAAAEMHPEQIIELRDMLATVRARCAELDRRLDDGCH